MHEKLDWLERQARIASQQIEREPKELQRIQENDTRVALSKDAHEENISGLSDLQMR